MDPMPHRPTDAEKGCYYLGLGGKLIARTSTSIIEPYDDTLIKDQKKQFFNIGDHVIISLWSDQIVSALQSALVDIEWERFYPIRIGNDSEFGRVLVLMVDIPVRCCMSWETAVEAALKCRRVLRSANVPDIEVEIRQIGQEPFAMDLEWDSLINWERGANFPRQLKEFDLDRFQAYSSNIGYQIAPIDETPSFSGTMGLHVRLSGKSQDVYGLTCRHVAHRTIGSKPFSFHWHPNEKSYDFDTGDGTHHLIIQGCSGDLDALRSHLKGDLLYREKEHKRLQWIAIKQSEMPERFGFREGEDRVLEDLNKHLPKAQKVVDRLQDILKDGDKTLRAIGHVAFMPALNCSPRGFLRDWALISLNQDKFREPPTNRIYFSEDHLGKLIHYAPDQGRIDDNGLLQLQGQVSLDMACRQSFHVAKRGGKSGLTMGKTNEIKAVVRLIANDRRIVTWEWIVISHGKQPFSEPGDSGAAVFDLEGRVLGMLTGGHGNQDEPARRRWKKYYPEDEQLPINEGEECDPQKGDQVPKGFSEYKGKDLTFITPVQILFEDIMAETGCEVEIV